MAFQAKELYQYKESVRYASVSNRVAKVLKKNWQLYLYMLLPMLYLIIFAYGPMFGIVIAFKDFSPQHGIWGESNGHVWKSYGRAYIDVIPCLRNQCWHGMVQNGG